MLVGSLHLFIAVQVNIDLCSKDQRSLHISLHPALWTLPPHPPPPQKTPMRTPQNLASNKRYWREILGAKEGRVRYLLRQSYELLNISNIEPVDNKKLMSYSMINILCIIYLDTNTWATTLHWDIQITTDIVYRLLGVSGCNWCCVQLYNTGPHSLWMGWLWGVS